MCSRSGRGSGAGPPQHGGPGALERQDAFRHAGNVLAFLPHAGNLLALVRQQHRLHAKEGQRRAPCLRWPRACGGRPRKRVQMRPQKFSSAVKSNLRAQTRGLRMSGSRLPAKQQADTCSGCAQQRILCSSISRQTLVRARAPAMGLIRMEPVSVCHQVSAGHSRMEDDRVTEQHSAMLVRHVVHSMHSCSSAHPRWGTGPRPPPGRTSSTRCRLQHTRKGA